MFCLLQQGERSVVDLNQTTAVLAPEGNVKGGLSVPCKERIIFRPTERKSILGSFYLSKIILYCL